MRLAERGLQLLDLVEQHPLTRMLTPDPATLRETGLTALEKLVLPTRDRLLTELRRSNRLSND